MGAMRSDLRSANLRPGSMSDQHFILWEHITALLNYKLYCDAVLSQETVNYYTACALQLTGLSKA
jgi:hypothetical protein